MLRRLAISFLSLLVIVVILASAMGVYLYRVHFEYINPSDTVVEISKGSTLRSIAEALEWRRVVSDRRAVILYVRYKKSENMLKAGEYEFAKGDTLRDVVERLIDGKVVLRQFTVPEGLTAKQIGELLDKKDLVKKENFLYYVYDPDTVSDLIGDSAASLEGYLYPDTYTYEKSITTREIVEAMVKNFNRVFDSLDVSKVNLSAYEIVTLASMIEKEGSVAEERSLISAVFHNRLKLGMRLECDPTVIYGLGDEFNGNLTKKHLETYSDYNTYVVSGLPPGPIANPGRDALEGAVNPDDVNYLYFVSKGDGTHKFSSSYKKHLRAVNEYQRRSRR